MSFSAFSTIGKAAMLGSTFVPAPTGLTYVASSATIAAITMTFTMPNLPGTTTYTPNVGTPTGSQIPTSYTIGSLAANTTYSVTLTAKNNGVTSKPSSPALSVLTLSNPPTALTFTSATTAQVVLSFTPPSGNGTITGYTSSPAGTGSSSAWTIASLSPNTTYSITMTATNSSGTSAASSPALSAVTAPGPPSGLTFTSATTAQIVLSFTPPSGNGTITSYASNYAGSGSSSAWTIGSLSPNTTYSITMTATNSSGTSVASSPALSAVTAPGPPTGLTFSSATSAQIVLTFTAPSGNGTITSYASNYAGSGSPSAWTIGSLSSNTYYSITTTATNASGTSSASSALSVLTLPAAPTNVSATVIDSTNVRVTFTGDSNTGSTITYTVTSSPGSFTATGTSSPITVNATFTSGTSYTFTVAAKNTSTSNGGGTTTSVTPSGSVTPLPKPSVATIVTTSLVINLDSNKGISGSTWTDQTGNGYNYTFYTSSNTATNYTTTTSNGYTVITLDGTTNYFWNSSGFDSYFKGSFTYEMWVYPTSLRNATLIYENGQGSFNGWSDDQMGTNSSGYFTSYVYSGGSIVGTTGGAYSINNWYQIVNVYDNTAHILYQYKNGALIAQVSITKSYPSKVYLVLGSQAGNGSSYMNGLGYFVGYIGAFRGYNIALSSAQVLNNYNAVSARYI